MLDSTSIKEMVERVVWMSPIHYEILDFYGSHDILISPRDLSENINYDRDYTGKACRKLAEAGLLKSSDQLYSLIDHGRAFLAGDLDVDELEEP